MKYKNILNIGLALVIGLIFAACSQSDDLATAPQTVKMQNGFYVYDVDFNCEVPSYDEGTTRIVTRDWQNRSTLFARLQSGSNYYQGFFVRETDGWKLYSSNDFNNLQTSGTCELFYFQESNGDYYYYNNSTGRFDIYNNGSFVKSTDIAWNSSPMDISEETAVYSTNSAEYTTGTNTFTLKAMLMPKMWRIRFSGSNGSTVIMDGSDNDFKFGSRFEWSTESAKLTWMTGHDTGLKVSGGYTPYIYGTFRNAASNKITVKTSSAIYTRTFDASNLPVGSSGYFDIPTESNYSSRGWTKVANIQEMALADILEKPFGIVDVNLKTDPYTKIREKLSSLYTLYNSSDDPTHEKSLSIYDSDNESLKYLTYRGLPVFGLYVSDSYVSYSFMIPQGALPDPYPTLDKIVQDFKNMGIAMSYEKRDGSSSYVADGSVSVGNINYSMYLDDWSKGNWIISVSMYITGKSSNVANCKFVPNNFLAFTDGCVTDWTVDSKVSKGYYKVYKKTDLSSKTDATIVSELKNTTERTASYLKEYTNYVGDLSANTNYVLCTVAFDSSGQQGELNKYEFKTRSSSLAKAELSDLKYGSYSGTNYWYFTLTARYSASSYYLYINQYESVYDWNEWYFRYRIYYAIQNNEYGMGTSDSVYSLWGEMQAKRTSTYFSICTWAIVSGKNLGNPDSYQGHISSSAPSLVKVKDNSSPEFNQISKKDGDALFNQGKLILVKGF